MSVVTAIVDAARKDGRFVVQVDGKPFVTVSLDMLDRLSLRVGEELSEGRRAALEGEAAALATRAYTSCPWSVSAIVPC